MSEPTELPHIDRFDYVGGSYPMAIKPEGEYVEYDDYVAIVRQLAEQRAELLALLKTTRDVLGAALMSAAPDFFENDADVASHSVVKSIDAVIARATGAAS